MRIQPRGEKRRGDTEEEKRSAKNRRELHLKTVKNDFTTVKNDLTAVKRFYDSEQHI